MHQCSIYRVSTTVVPVGNSLQSRATVEYEMHLNTQYTRFNRVKVSRIVKLKVQICGAFSLFSSRFLVAFLRNCDSRELLSSSEGLPYQSAFLHQLCLYARFEAVRWFRFKSRPTSTQNS